MGSAAGQTVNFLTPVLIVFFWSQTMAQFVAFRMPIAAQILATTVMLIVPERIAQAQANPTGHRLIIEGEFAASESRSDRKPRGISGMACLGTDVDKKRECLAINDEELSAEVASLQDDSSPRSHDDAFHVEAQTAPVVLIPQEDAIGKIVGVKPTSETANCPEPSEKKFKELDGEGIALADGYIYVSGSHACSREGKLKPSTFLLTRFKAASADTISSNVPPTIERTWRLGDVLPPIPPISAWDKENPDALAELGQKQRNIEGIAVVDGRLYAGLRTPNVGGDILIVSAPVDALFAAGDKRLPAEVVTASKEQEIRVHFDNPNTGIRDLAALPNTGGLLMLTGPTLEQADVGYDLYWMRDLKSHSSPEHLLTIPTGLTKVWNKKGEAEKETEKAETLTVLSETPGKATVLILFDNVDEGRPTRYEAPLPLVRASLSK
jgi:hypothetical protein